MPFISLNRRFFEWNDKEALDPEIRRAFGLDEGGVGWDEVLSKLRVVVLAEAGTGKSTELEERARILAVTKKYSFRATVEDVGRDGLDDALDARSRKSLEEWRQSDEDAWFFIDSVDEAKGHGIRLEKVLRRLASGLDGAERRAHVILSGRMTDWEFRKDLNSLNEWLPIPPPVLEPDSTPEETLLRIVRNERRAEDKAKDAERPLVLRMAPLDRERVLLFAQGKSLTNIPRFLEAIELADLWHFARRPLDLDWLVRFWQTEGRLGSLAEMIELSIAERLKETNTDRARADGLDSMGLSPGLRQPVKRQSAVR